MNAAAILARGEYLLFLHADSRLPETGLLADALSELQTSATAGPRVAGHFRLRFIRSHAGGDLFYRYMEAKTALNRVNTTNGDQGLLLSRAFFAELGVRRVILANQLVGAGNIAIALDCAARHPDLDFYVLADSGENVADLAEAVAGRPEAAPRGPPLTGASSM